MPRSRRNSVPIAPLLKLVGGKEVMIDYRKYDHPLFDRYDDLQTEAKAARRGIHGTLLTGATSVSPVTPITPARPAAAARPRPRSAAGTRIEPREKLPPFFVTVTMTGKIHRGTCDSRYVMKDRKAGKIEVYKSVQDAQEGHALDGEARWKGTSSCRVCRPYLY